MSRPPEEVLWDFLRGATMTKALGIVVDLRLPEALADGPRSVDELARDAGVDADALYRLLRALASDGVFEEQAPGTFALNAGSKPLLEPGWSAFAHLFGDVFYKAIGDLDIATRTGAVTFPDTFGTGFWPWLAEHPEQRAIFDRAMGGGKQVNADRLAALEWADGDVVVDVGGGNGSLLVELLRRRPGLHGVILDLPETVRDEAALGPDIEFVAGSFFEAVPTGDAYVLSGIIHDWNDEAATAILRTIRAAAPPHARLLITETVIEPGNEPEGAKWLDLLMHVLAGGRERTEREWRALLVAAEFEPVSIENGLIEARCS
jgi:O-methyltransferase domain